ncbi:D-amino acid dehydrogenase [Massilia sp. S19_KUP03_FR1]|uniref:D-amino acid dehydrogenase n=1 Tax=Massilia sp. S19_KUP03_FR1 TaxID=3025503 RepID=UPI002FCDCE25
MKQVIVIGGGVVGLTSAWWLLEAGFGVTLLERAPQVASAASARNGGQLSYRYVAPLADAGVPLKALQWLFDKNGPLRFRPEADLRQWRWLASFLKHCSAAVNRTTTGQLLQLGELSRHAMAQLETHVRLDDFAWRDAGKLVVYRSAHTFAAAASRPDAGLVLSAAECVAREPALAAAEPVLAGGIYNSGEAVADCHAFCQALAARLQAHPGFRAIVHADAHSLINDSRRIVGVRTNRGVLQADAYVLAAGIQSRTLAQTAGIYLPLYPLKGYSLSAPIRAIDTAPEISVTDFERKVLYARIGSQLRVAAMVDMVGEDTRLDAHRLATLTRQVRATMPHAADYDHIVPWAGLRPATPGSAPIIGATGYDNLWLNVGHGPLGFTFACGSATVLADLMQGKAAPMPLDGLSLR